MQELETLKRGLVDLVSGEELAKKLAAGRKLRVKLGVDPTTPDLHVGHTVVLQKLRAFQDLGHTAVLIIGDFTTRVGDPSGRDSTRPRLTVEQIAANAKTYEEQAYKVLDPDQTEIVRNSDWLEPFIREGLLPAMQRHTVQQLLAREDFQNRLQANNPITLLEILYPLLQGQDSVAVKADVELGGTDQIFNLLMGRTMQKNAGQEPQVVMTLPLLVGLDGSRKMSKSYGNHIGIGEPAREIFGKVMKISDEQMRGWYELLTAEDLEAVGRKHPMEAKKELAQLLTARFHGAEAGRAEREFFAATFSKRQAPADVRQLALAEPDKALTWSAYLLKIGAAKSRKEAVRLLQQGAVRVDDVKIVSDAPLAEHLGARKSGTTAALKVGKHKFFQFRFE